MISDSTATSEGMIAASEAYNASGAVPYHVRSIGEIAGFFDGRGGRVLRGGPEAVRAPVAAQPASGCPPL